ncbi:MAG: flagellar biosynthetic protein FliO [Pseudomonadota bacterium]
MTLGDVLQIVLSLAIVLGLLSGFAVVAKHFGLSGGHTRSSRKRLKIVETLSIDQKRRAAIIQCDGKEHLLILNQNSVNVIERNISADHQPTGATASDENTRASTEQTRIDDKSATVNTLAQSTLVQMPNEWRKLMAKARFVGKTVLSSVEHQNWQKPNWTSLQPTVDINPFKLAMQKVSRTETPEIEERDGSNPAAPIKARKTKKPKRQLSKPRQLNKKRQLSKNVASSDVDPLEKARAEFMEAYQRAA